MLPTNRPPTHPGEMLLEEFLKPLGLPQAQAARRMDISINRLNEIVHGKRGITAETALKLAALLGTTPEIWMDLQTRWDLYQARERLGEPKIELVRESAPLRA